MKKNKTFKTTIIAIVAMLIASAVNAQNSNYSGIWIDNDEITKLVLHQNGNKVSGTVYTTSHGCEWTYPECAEPINGTITNGVVNISFYSAYQGKRLNAKLKLLSNDKIEWIPVQIGNKFTLTKQK